MFSNRKRSKKDKHAEIITLYKIPKNYAFREISRLIGSGANYAGDGPTRRYGSLNLNGIHITKIASKYYVDEIYGAVFRDRYPRSAIKVGDEVIKINRIYCEHLGHVGKYIEKTPIKLLQMKTKLTGEYFVEEVSNAELLNLNSTLLQNTTPNAYTTTSQ